MGVNPSQAKTHSLKYFVVNNAKQVQRKVNTTAPTTQAYQVYDLVVPSL